MVAFLYLWLVPAQGKLGLANPHLSQDQMTQVDRGALHEAPHLFRLEAPDATRSTRDLCSELGHKLTSA
jgi:hypothetical protein